MIGRKVYINLNFRLSTVVRCSPIDDISSHSGDIRLSSPKVHRIRADIFKYKHFKFDPIFTARCYAERGYATEYRPSARLSVSPSVCITFTYCDHSLSLTEDGILRKQFHGCIV